MDEDKEIQILVKKTPAFTVLKNGSILKNIFLLRKPPPFSTEQSAADTSSINQEPDEEILLVGRHPNCNITLEHPSISRYHLRIHTNPSSLKLCVVDLSSVHGTWVSGKRIQPGVPVKLKEGDTVKMGGSSRVYELHWVPLSQAFNVDDPFVPATFSKQEETQDENCLSPEILETYSSDDDEFEPVNHGTANEEPFSVLKCSKSCCDDTEAEHSSPWRTGDRSNEIFANISGQAPQVVPETMPATESSETINKLEDQSNSLRDNTINESESISSIDDTRVEHLSAMITSNENVEIFASVPIQTRVVVSESLSETKILDSLNKSEDLSLALFDAIKTPEKDSLIQDLARGNETDMVTENEQMNHMEMTNEPDSMVLCTSIISREEIDTGVKFESVNHETTKKESVFLALLDEARAKEDSRTLFDSSNGKELEFFTPDKENKDPNSCSKRSLRRRWLEDENKQSNNCTMLKKDVGPTVNEGKDIFGYSRNLPVYCDEVLFSLEKEDKSRLMEMEGIGNSINHPQSVQKVINSSNKFLGGAKKRWTMVLDTNTLLHNNSLKHLNLLQGLKGTQLFIPKYVLKELMDINSQHDLFNRTTKKVSLALKWIEECTITTRWWIHIDDEQNEREAEVLETALRLCKEIKDGKIIILSNDLSLKIKSIAEGIMCEEAEEFFRSLVNPFSERFMWAGSLARGLSWSCVDDDDEFLREKYGKCGVNVSNRLKGLKLLAHITTV